MKLVRSLCLTALALAGCTTANTPSGTGSLLTILGASSPSSALRSLWTPVGGPASMSITMYDLYLSPNTDCSGATLVQSYGSAGVVKDFTASPTLFQADVAAGTYPCVAIHLSDVIGFTSANAGAVCQTGVQYWMDIYRPDQNDTWLDPSLVAIPVSGTDSAPSNDRPWIYFTTDTAAAMAAGYSHGQTIQLTNSLTVPSTVTFVWDATNAVGEDAGLCGMNPGTPSFQ